MSIAGIGMVIFVGIFVALLTNTIFQRKGNIKSGEVYYSMNKRLWRKTVTLQSPLRSKILPPSCRICRKPVRRKTRKRMKEKERPNGCKISQIKLHGIKQFLPSIGITSSHIQMIPPYPGSSPAFSTKANFLTSRLSGLADFLISRQ